MTKTEKAAFDAVVRLVKRYRAEAETRQYKPMDEKRAKEILALPSAELVNLCIKLANLTAAEEQAVNYCYRLGYTQEETADILNKSRNTIYTWCRSGIAKCVRAWDGVFWLQNL